MRHTLRISYSCYLKNKSRPSARYYARVREDGHVRDIDLNTRNRAVAEAWVALRRDEVVRYNNYVLCGEEVPEDLESRIVHGTMAAVAQKGPSRASFGMLHLIDEFELDCRRRGLRERTVGAYVRNVRQIVPVDAKLTDFTRDNVLRWLSKYDNLKSATRKFYSVSMRELTKFLVNNYGVDVKILSQWGKIKVESAERGYWRMHEIRAIINAVKCHDSLMEEQMKCYLWIMATCGSRQGETAAVLWSDLKDGNITLRGENTKTGKTRVVPLDRRVLDMLAHLKLRKESKFIFSAIPKSQAGRYSILAKAIGRSGMPNGGLHTLRHSASMYLYSKTNDLKAVSQYLGHSPATALKYYQASRQTQELRRMVDEAYGDENLIPSKIDSLIKDGFV